MQTEIVKITGMTCGGCASKVTNALKSVNGVGDVVVSVAAGEATVQFDQRVTSVDEINSAVQRAGYGVGIANAPEISKRKGCCCG